MHDLIKEMGREIVRQQFLEEPGKHNRLQFYEDIYDVLKKNIGNLFYVAQIKIRNQELFYFKYLYVDKLQ